MLENLKNLTGKLAWALFNTLPPKAIQYEKVPSLGEAPRSTLVVMIDYDKFSERKTKALGRVTYPCGKEGLEHVLAECKSRNLEYINVITTDDEHAPRIYGGCANQTIRIRNGGSDIAALEAITAMIARYKFVIVINSSANVKDAKNFHLLHDELVRVNVEHFVIGFNGNSRISPRLPLTPALTPHVTTNFFACPAAHVLETLQHARRIALYQLSNGFANKYFAIRYFETLLSLNAISNGGTLGLLRGDGCLYYHRSKDRWPRADSRLTLR